MPRPSINECCSGSGSASMAGVTSSCSHWALFGCQRPHISLHRTHDPGQCGVVAVSWADFVSCVFCDHKADSVLFSVGRKAPCRVSEQDPVTALAPPSPTVTALASGVWGCHFALARTPVG